MSSTSESKADFPDHVLARNQIDTRENQALFKAALAGSLEGVMDALEDGARPNYFYRPEDSKNALHVASENGYTDIVEALLKHGAVVDSLCIVNKATALHFAAAEGNDDVLKILLQHKADPCIANAFGNTALHEAARGGTAKAIELLVDAGAEVNAINKKGSSPLNFACFAEDKGSRSVRVVEALLRLGASVHCRDHQGLTPLLICCSSGREDLLDLLVDAGADIRARDNSGRTAVEIADFYHRPHTSSHARAILMGTSTRK